MNMSTTLNLPFWHCSSPPNVPDCSEELDIIIQRLAAGDTDLDVDSQAQSQIPLDNGMPASGLPPICDSESADPSKFNEIYHLNNNVSDASDYKCEEKNGKCNPEYLCPGKNGPDDLKCVGDGWDESSNEIPGDVNIDKRNTYKDKIENRIEMCQTGRSSVENKVCGISGTVGGDGEESDRERERSPRQQHEPVTNEINTSDVILSRDLTLNPLESNSKKKESVSEVISRRDRRISCSTTSSTCSAGSYSRRKHHKHHKHKKNNPPSEDPPPVTPKVNPIFLWVRQDDTRIVEVMCEDYDYRNRIRLTKTHLGWRAIPKTEIFASAIIPKPQSDPESVPDKSRSRKKISKRRKSKKKRSKTLEKGRKSGLLDNPNIIKECSVALSRENVELYQNKLFPRRDDSVESLRSQESVRSRSNSSRDVNSRHSSRPSSRQSVNNSRSVSQESIDELSLCNGPLQRLRNLPKSNSCDFSSPKISQSLVKSKSLDFNIKSENVTVLESDHLVQNDEESDNSTVLSAVKNEPENTKEDIAEVDFQKEDDCQRHQIVDMTKHDSDFNDADCDELGQLLKDIPDLEFVEEEELEEVEEEDWPAPTDLTVPKSKEDEGKPPRVKLPILPPNISSLVTVTSSTRPPEPLTAPLPEVTITPIPNPNPKPAHQQKPQNKFLETLLSTPHAIKPERDEVTITRTSDKRPLECGKRSHDAESKAKKLKAENITLKSLLAKQQYDKSIKGLDLETCVKKMKNKQENENVDCSKSRLHELLTDGVTPANVDPLAQLKQVLSNPDLAVPDPLLVPRARLPALVASPASEIPRLLTMHLDKKVEEAPCPPLSDPDMLEVSLSNLRSLLSYSPDKMKDADDLAAYQKSLEAFLEWQRYQTELMEAQIKNSGPLTPGLPPGEIDVATANALNQMLWLPYLNQLDLNCNGNRDFMSLMNTMMSHNYSGGNNLSAPPHISTNHFTQSSPFLTPTSPMDIESQMKTLAMWQEAVMSQQNLNPSRNKLQNTPLSPTHAEPRLKIPNVPPPSKKQMLSPLPSPQKMRGNHNNNNNYSQFSPSGNQKNHFNYDNYHQMQMQQQQQQNLLRQQQQMVEFHRKQQKRQCEMQMRQAEHHRQMEMQQRQEQHLIQFQQMQQNYSDFHQEISRQIKSEADKSDKSDRRSKEPKQGTISVKPLSNLMEKNQSKKSSSWQQFEEELKKSAELTNQMALRWKQFEEEMRKSQIQITKNQNKNKIKMENVSEWPPNIKAVDEPRAKLPSNNTLTTPKLKVKNLVDPNMSPPKLLKQIDPEHLPVVVNEPGPVLDESQAHLWHPFFGNKADQPYNSPWRWTTVTVNGE